MDEGSSRSPKLLSTIVEINIAMVSPVGVAADPNHLEMKSKMRGYVYMADEKAVDKLEKGPIGCHIVLIPASVPCKPNRTRDDHFEVNADVAKGLVSACANFCPDTILLLMSRTCHPLLCNCISKKISTIFI